MDRVENAWDLESPSAAKDSSNSHKNAYADAVVELHSRGNSEAELALSLLPQSLSLTLALLPILVDIPI